MEFSMSILTDKLIHVTALYILLVDASGGDSRATVS